MQGGRTKPTVDGRDAIVELTGTYLQRVGVDCRPESAYFDISGSQACIQLEVTELPALRPAEPCKKVT